MGLVGHEYATWGVDVLRVMIGASFFVAVTFLFFSIKRVQKDIGSMVLLNGAICALLVGGAYVFLPMFGVVGVGYAWVLSYGVGCLGAGILVGKEKWGWFGT